jgi:hypothetical protein
VMKMKMMKMKMNMTVMKMKMMKMSRSVGNLLVERFAPTVCRGWFSSIYCEA